MNNICDDFKSNCLVRPVCSKMCDDMNTLVDSFLNHHLDKPWIFHDLVTNEHCPVCHKEHFWYTEYTTAIHANQIFIKLICDFCNATYRLRTHKVEDYKLAPDKLMQSYQGTENGKVDDLWSMKVIKYYLLSGRKD